LIIVTQRDILKTQGKGKAETKNAT